MSKRILFVLLTLVSLSFAQTRYSWTDTVAVNTVGFDSTFTVKWEEVSIWFKDCNGWVRYSTSLTDTASWANRDFIFLLEGTVIRFTDSERLSRIQVKAASGSGVCQFSGLKKVRRY